MRTVFATICSAAAASIMSGCAVIPDVPPDYSLPVRQIIRHSVCELRVAMQYMKDNNPSFKADGWSIGITLTPKVDTEASFRAGLTGKSTTASAPNYFNTWVVGSGPGIEYDAHGTKTATANYQLSSASLLSENKFGEYQYPLECDTTSQTYNALSEHLAIQDWLKRSASAADSDLSALTSVDKPTFTADIVIKFDGAGSFTYNYPFGTDFLGFMGSYSIDEKLEIALLKSPTITDFSKVRTLPLTAPYKDGIVAIGQGPVGHISEDAKTKLDQLQLEQVLRNLQLSVPTRR